MTTVSRHLQNYKSINYILSMWSIDHGTHVPGPFTKSSSESKYNAACTAKNNLAHFRMLILELFNKDPDIVTKEALVIVWVVSLLYVSQIISRITDT